MSPLGNFLTILVTIHFWFIAGQSRFIFGSRLCGPSFAAQFSHAPLLCKAAPLWEYDSEIRFENTIRGCTFSSYARVASRAWSRSTASTRAGWPSSGPTPWACAPPATPPATGGSKRTGAAGRRGTPMPPPARPAWPERDRLDYY